MLQGVTKEKTSILEQLYLEIGLDAKLIVHNDDSNTFNWVIQSLIEICQHTSAQAEQCVLIIHYRGKYAVREGDKIQLKPMREALVDRGINATIE